MTLAAAGRRRGYQEEAVAGSHSITTKSRGFPAQGKACCDILGVVTLGVFRMRNPRC